MQRITTNIFNSHMRLLRQRLHGFIKPHPPLSILLYFKLKDVLTEDIPLKLTHLMNKQMCFFDKMC